MGCSTGTGYIKDDKCVLGRKPKSLKLGEEPESAFRPIRLDEDDAELNPHPAPLKTYAPGANMCLWKSLLKS